MWRYKISLEIIIGIKRIVIIIDYGIATGLIPLWLMIMEIVNA